MINIVELNNGWDVFGRQFPLSHRFRKIYCGICNVLKNTYYLILIYFVFKYPIFTIV